MNEIEMHRCAVRLVLAMMRSASTEKISPYDWWSRAQSAIHSAASRAGSYGHMVSVMGRKLQIETTSTATAETVSELAQTLSDDEIFEAFRDLCERDALYIVAEAQATRALEREEEKRNDQTDNEAVF